MHYEIHQGPEGADWLLLVHGLLSSRNHWAPNLAGLSRHFNLVAVDLPAHGLSPSPAPRAEWRPEAMVARLDAIRSVLGLSQWYLCGQSFGAGLTLRYALEHPERVRAQVFTNARSIFRDPDDPEERAVREARVAGLRAGGMAALEAERFHPQFAHRFPPELRARLVEDAALIDIEGYARLLEIALPLSSLRHQLRDIQTPTLLVNGRHERLFQPYRAGLESRWPGLEIVDIDGGHSVNIENPEGFDPAVIDFLTRYPIAANGLAAEPYR